MGDRRGGERRAGPSRSRVGGGARRPDAARLRAQDCVVAAASAGLAAAGRTRRRAPERRGGASAGTAPRRAPRPSRAASVLSARASASLGSGPSPPSFPPPSLENCGSSDGELAVASRARPLRLTWAPAPSPETRPPGNPPVRAPALRALHANLCPWTRLDGWVRTRPASSATRSGARRLAPTGRVLAAGTPEPGEAGDATGRQVAGLAWVPRDRRRRGPCLSSSRAATVRAPPCRCAEKLGGAATRRLPACGAEWGRSRGGWPWRGAAPGQTLEPGEGPHASFPPPFVFPADRPVPAWEARPPQRPGSFPAPLRAAEGRGGGGRSPAGGLR